MKEKIQTVGYINDSPFPHLHILIILAVLADYLFLSPSNSTPKISHRINNKPVERS